jgi:hypothetical protein
MWWYSASSTGVSIDENEDWPKITNDNKVRAIEKRSFKFISFSN